MTWAQLLDHLITVEGECMEENYGKGRALNDADEECNAGIRKAYQSLLKVKPSLMAAPDLLEQCKYLLENAEAACWSEFMLADARAAIAKAEGRPSETTPD